MTSRNKAMTDGKNIEGEIINIVDRRGRLVHKASKDDADKLVASGEFYLVTTTDISFC